MSSVPSVEGYRIHSYALSGCTLNRYEPERMKKENVPQLLRERLAHHAHLVVFSPSSSHVLASTASTSTRWFFALSSATTDNSPSSALTSLPSPQPQDAMTLTVKDMKTVLFIGEFPDTGVNLFVTSSENVASTLPPLDEQTSHDGRSDICWKSTRHDNFINTLPREEQAALGLCLSLQRWHSSHGFCSTCGHPTDASVDLGFSRFCAQCQTQHFPRIMPAMIAAVFDGRGNVLLSRRSLKSEIYTVLSGFALLGESFEETVCREVKEETGATVTFVRYIGSQPWPYPYLVMLVYYAVAPHSPTLTLEKAELVDVRWVPKEEVRLALDGANPRLQLHGPGTTPYMMLKPWVDGLVDDWGRPAEGGVTNVARSQL